MIRIGCYSMKFNAEIGNAIAINLREIYPNIPLGKPWIKYGKNRIYFNLKQDGVEYGFSIQFFAESIELNDFMEEYWKPLLGISSVKELEHAVDDLYYEAAYPLKIAVPVKAEIFV